MQKGSAKGAPRPTGMPSLGGTALRSLEQPTMIKIFMQLKPDPNHAGCAGTRASAGVPGIDPASVPGPSGRDGTTIPTATDRQGDRPKPVMPPQALVDGGPEAKPGAPYPLASEAAEAPLPA